MKKTLTRRQLLSGVAVLAVSTGIHWPSKTSAQFPSLKDLNLKQLGIDDPNAPAPAQEVPEIPAAPRVPVETPVAETPPKQTPVETDVKAAPAPQPAEAPPQARKPVQTVETAAEPVVEEKSEPEISLENEGEWDAVYHYTGSNTDLLAPRVPVIEVPDPPLPHMKSKAFLIERNCVFEADLERTNATRSIQVKGKPDGFLNATGRVCPDGFILVIPPGHYRIDAFGIRIQRGLGFNIGARIIVQGRIGPNGEHPQITVEKGGFATVGHRDTKGQNVFESFELANVELNSPSVGVDAGPGVFQRYFKFDNVLFSEGFKNCSHPANWPTIGIYNNCVFARGGRGGGLTHSFYGSYIQALLCRNCLWTSANKEGHPLKIYAQHVDVQGCTIANWWNTKDHDDGYYSDQAPIDIGARGQSIIANCHIIKRGNTTRTRSTAMIDYRNRVFEKGALIYRPDDFGTDATEVDYHLVDNEVGTATEKNPASDLLFRHVLINNKFFNGVLPDGSEDRHIKNRPGAFVRNSGTIYQWSHGTGSLPTDDPDSRTTPSDYQKKNERAVVYIDSNELLGVPIKDMFPGPYGHESDPSPKVQLGGERPDWIQSRMANSGIGGWWPSEWASTEYYPA